MTRYTDMQMPANTSVGVETGLQDLMMPKIEEMAHGSHPGLTLAHWHPHWKVNYVAGGSGLCIINGTTYTIQQGDLVLIPPQHLHRMCGIDQLLLEVFHFDMHIRPNSRWGEETSSHLHRIGHSVPHVLERSLPQCGVLTDMLKDMKNELAQREAGFATIVEAQYIRFLVLINRYASRPHAAFSPSPSRGVQTIKEVIRVMESQLALPWTLKKLSDLAHLSPSRFSALFQQTLGTSPLDYLIKLRLAYAAQLLTSSTEKIIEIAAESGFRNLSNFNRLFKDHFQMSPSELRDLNNQLQA